MSSEAESSQTTVGAVFLLGAGAAALALYFLGRSVVRAAVGEKKE